MDVLDRLGEGALRGVQRREVGTGARDHVFGDTGAFFNGRGLSGHGRSRQDSRPGDLPPHAFSWPIHSFYSVEEHMIVLGIILLLIGFIAKVAILWTIGIVLLVIGLVLVALGAMGRAVGGRRHYY
jgi:hypothetical protein